MTQTVPATAVLGPGKTGLTIGLRVLNLDGTTYAAFATTGVAETNIAGTYRKASGVVCPEAGGYIVWGTSVLDLAEATVEAGAQAAAAAALTAYDPPTNTEFEARTLAAADYVVVGDTLAAVTMVTTTTNLTNLPAAAATAAELAKVPKSDGTASWNATALAAINAQADTALADYDPPTNAEMEARTLAAADYVVVGDTLAAVTTVGSVTAGVTLADDAITAAKFDETTAFPLKSADTGATAVARTGADSDTLETLSDQIDGIIAAGAGTGLYTDTITDGTDPLDGVRVQLSTDSAGTDLAYEAYTNALGVFTLRPDPGTYYRWLDLSGYTFTQGVEVTVT